MPKASKKNKEKNSAKLKLGKGKQAPSNAVDTSVKARYISLPSQRLAVEQHDSAPTTKRKLSFPDLIAHMKHHNAGVRKDAISGLRELLEAYPELLLASLTSLLNACVRLLGDKDASVRKALLSFFDWLLPKIPQEMLAPHSSLLLLFTSAAQTNVFPEIRIDALRFLDILINHIPQTLTRVLVEGNGGHGIRILEGFLGILNTGTKSSESQGQITATSTASVMLSPASKLTILRSLSNVLRHTLSFSPNGISGPSSAFVSTPHPTFSFSDGDVSGTLDWFLHRSSQPGFSRSSRKSWDAEVELEVGEHIFITSCEYPDGSLEKPWTLRQLSDAGDLIDAGPDLDASRTVDLTFVANLAHTLHQTLRSSFLDSAPAVFSSVTSPPEIDVGLIVVVGEITQCLYKTIFHKSVSENVRIESACADVTSLLSCMSPYFPFRHNGNRDIKLEQAFQELNLIFCELTSLLVSAPEIQPNSRQKKSRQAYGRQVPVQIERVSEYIIQLLDESVERPLTSSAYDALLPTIWSILYHPSLRHLSSGVLQAAIGHATRVSSTASLKEATVEFVARIVLVDTQHHSQGASRVRRHPQDDKMFEEWICHLPHTLLGLQQKNLSCAETIFRFLLRFCQRNSSLGSQEVIACVRSRLVQYFAVSTQSRSPYMKSTNSATRRLTLDVVYMLSRFGNDCGDGLEVAVDQAVLNTAEADYWAHLRSRPS